MPKKVHHGPHRLSRPYVVPPALLRSGEPFDGYHILDEVRNADGVLLWQTLRDVVIWATTPQDRRIRLFAPEARSTLRSWIRNSEVDDEAKVPLLLLSSVLDSQEQPDRGRLATTCRRVSQWAEERGLLRTAIWYAQAAALSFPEIAEYAYQVGAICRRNAESARAETWYRRAIGLARTRHDAQIYARSYMGLGSLFMHRGEYERAKAAFERAYRAARRAGFRRVRAESLHDLFTVALETHRVAEAETLARRAFKAYDSSHPQLPKLAHDVGVFWMLQGFFSRALSVLQAVSRVITRPADQLLVLSNVARAAGGAGERDVFASAWSDTWQLIDGRPTLECVTSSLLRLAYGSASLGDRERVDLAARLAIDLATERGEQQVRNEALSLLKRIESQDFTEPVVLPPAGPEFTEAAETLAAEMVSKLAVCAGGKDHPRIPY